MNKIECAVSCFKEGFSCSQALLSTYGPQFDLNREMALKVSGAFGGGIGHMGETCGAVTGVIMVIGLKYGKTRAEDEQIEEKAYSLIQEFVDKFNSRNGSIICRELLGYDISTPEGMKLAKEKNLFITICPKLVQDAAEIIEQILE
ncbi:MAG: putative redox-active protein [Candidatus Methanomarinus sp.]|nr:MAG: putative redox-active protein [ANME-2 cluster archaeon]